MTWRSKSWQRKRFKSNIQLCKSFHKVIKLFKPDICFVQVASEAGRSMSVLCKLYAIPLVLAEHSSPEALGLVEGGRKKDYLLLKFVYNQCSYVTCVSQNLTDTLKKYYPKLTPKTIYNGIQPVSTYTKSEKIYKLENVINIVIVGGFYNMTVKGYQFLLPAIKEVVQKGYQIVLHICGGGEYKEYFEELVKKLDIVQQCIFYGQCQREKIYDIVGQMDFFVSASLFESGGMAAQEAMLLGKPVLATKSGGVSSMITKETGIIIDKGSIKSLVDGIIRMIQIYKEFDVEKIKKYAESKFDINHITKQYMEVFEEILQKKEY